MSAQPRELIRDLHLQQACNHDISPMLAQRLGVTAAVDTDHPSKGAAPASFDASQGVLEHDSANRRNPEAAGGFQKKRWIWLARQPELGSIDAVHTRVDKVINSCSVENGGAILAG